MIEPDIQSGVRRQWDIVRTQWNSVNTQKTVSERSKTVSEVSGTVSDASSVPLCYATINIAEKGYQNVPVHPSSTATIAILCGVVQCSATVDKLSSTPARVAETGYRVSEHHFYRKFPENGCRSCLTIASGS
eukprot:scpid58777/ scgid5090/ 